MGLGNNFPWSSLIFWWEKSASGHEQQTLFHELDHMYYEGLRDGTRVLNYQCSSNCIYTATLKINGMNQVFTWDTSLQGGSVSQGYYGFEHLLIHNDLVQAFTNVIGYGALAEAFSGASPYPTESQWQFIIKNYQSVKVPIDQTTPASPPISGQSCPSGSFSVRRIPYFPRPPRVHADVAY